MLNSQYGMMLLLCRYKLRHINHASINFATSILGGRRWHDIWRIRWSTTRYWRNLRLYCCVLWRDGWILTNWGQLEWTNDWIIKLRRHKYHRWWKIVSLWVTVLSIKALVITRSVLWRYGWILTNRGKLRCIDDWIVQRRRHRYHQWWKLVALWLTVLAIKAPVITRSCLFYTLIVPCSYFVATNNTLCMLHDECNMSFWWCCVPVILFFDGHKKLRANFLLRQLQSCLSFSTRNKIDYEIFVSI